MNPYLNKIKPNRAGWLENNNTRRFRFQSGIPYRRVDWRNLLVRKNWSFLTDNLLMLGPLCDPADNTCNTVRGALLGVPRPGIMRADYLAPPLNLTPRWLVGNTLGHVSLLRVEPAGGGPTIQLAHDSAGHACYPDHLTGRFTSDGIELRQQITIWDDTVVCRVRLKTKRPLRMVNDWFQPHDDLRPSRGDLITAPPAALAKCHQGGLSATVRPRPYGRLLEWAAYPGQPLYLGVHSGLAAGSGAYRMTRNPLAVRVTREVSAGTHVFNLIFTVHASLPETDARMTRAVRSPARLFRRAAADWDNYFGRVVPYFNCPDERYVKTYYWMFYHIKAGMLESSGIRQQHVEDHAHNFHLWTPFTVGCSKYFFPRPPHENSANHLAGAKWLNDDALVWFDAQHMGLGMDEGHGVLAVLHLWDAFQKIKDVRLLQCFYPLIRKSLVTLPFRCDRNRNGLVDIDGHGQAAGAWDNSQRWEYALRGTPVFEFEKFAGRVFDRRLEVVDTSCYAYLAYQAGAHMAARLGLPDDRRRFSDRARAIRAAINRHMWHDDFYHDILFDTGRPTPIQTAAGLYPLFTDIPSADQARRLAAHLENPRKFNAPFAVPCCAMDHPRFQARPGEFLPCNWRGDVGVRFNWAIVQGLIQHGCPRPALGILESMIERMHRFNYDAAEMWNPLTGEGDWQSSPEGGMIADLIIKHVVGLTPGDGDALFINPVGLDRRWETMSFGPCRYGGHVISVDWRRAAGRRKSVFIVKIDGKASRWTAPPRRRKIL